MRNFAALFLLISLNASAGFYCKDDTHEVTFSDNLNFALVHGPQGQEELICKNTAQEPRRRYPDQLSTYECKGKRGTEHLYQAQLFLGGIAGFHYLNLKTRHGHESRLNCHW